MTTRNDITGDVIATKSTSEAYRSNYDAIFRKTPDTPVEIIKEELPSKSTEQLEKEQADAERMK